MRAVHWAGLEAFAAVSCLQPVVGKTSFVPGNVNQYNLLPINKLLITSSGTEKNIYVQGLRENTSSSPVLISNPLTTGYTQSHQQDKGCPGRLG